MAILFLSRTQAPARFFETLWLPDLCCVPTRSPRLSAMTNQRGRTSSFGWIVGEQEVETTAPFDGAELAKSSADSSGLVQLMQLAGGDSSAFS